MQRPDYPYQRQRDAYPHKPAAALALLRPFVQLIQRPERLIYSLLLQTYISDEARSYTQLPMLPLSCIVLSAKSCLFCLLNKCAAHIACRTL